MQQDMAQKSIFRLDEKLLEVDDSELSALLLNLKEVVNGLNVT